MRNTDFRMWVTFNFTDGSNPYIATRSDSFFYMVCAYQLEQIAEFGFRATYIERPITARKWSREEKKNILREFAITWQSDFNKFNYSWGEVAEWGAFFTEYGKRYGLLREFRENGII